MSELETLFSAAAPNSDRGSTAGKSNRRTVGHKSDKIQLVISLHSWEWSLYLILLIA
jgi:hypothetical protein